MAAYVCQACTLSSSKDSRKCPACGNLNTMIFSEEAVFHPHLLKATAKMLPPRIGMNGFAMPPGAGPIGVGGLTGRGFSLDRDDDENEEEQEEDPRLPDRTNEQTVRGQLTAGSTRGARILARGRQDDEGEGEGEGEGGDEGEDEEEDEERKFIMLSEVEDIEVDRLATPFPEFDRVFGEDELMGSGMPKGCGILLWGDSGLGKSTLCLEMLVPWAKAGIPVAYGCGEMQVQQVKQYVKRLCLDDAEALSRFVLYPGTCFDEFLEILEHYESEDGQHIGAAVTDSISVFYMKNLIGKVEPGGARQLKSISEIGTKHAQKFGYGQFFICHVTKGGDVAGPKTVQHHVDICIEGYLERKADPKIVGFRNVDKTRFGRSGAVCYFVMDERTGRLTPSTPDGSFDPGTVEAAVRMDLRRKAENSQEIRVVRRPKREEPHLQEPEEESTDSEPFF